MYAHVIGKSIFVSWPCLFTSNVAWSKCKKPKMSEEQMTDRREDYIRLVRLHIR